MANIHYREYQVEMCMPVATAGLLLLILLSRMEKSPASDEYQLNGKSKYAK